MRLVSAASKQPLTTKRQLAVYLTWTFVITWPIWFLKVFLIEWGFLAPAGLPALILHKVGNFGPTLAALLVLRQPFRENLRLLFSPGKRGGWRCLLVLLGLLSLTVGLAASGRLVEGLNPVLTILGFLSASFLAAGIAEEAGWRGFLQPVLEERFTFPLATLLTGLIWAVWHLPLMVLNLTAFPLFLLYTLLYAFGFAGLYKRTGSVLYCMLLHGFINAGASDVFAAEGRNETILLLGYAVMAVYGAYVWYRTDRERQPGANMIGQGKDG